MLGAVGECAPVASLAGTPPPQFFPRGWETPAQATPKPAPSAYSCPTGDSQEPAAHMWPPADQHDMSTDRPPVKPADPKAGATYQSFFQAAQALPNKQPSKRGGETCESMWSRIRQTNACTRGACPSPAQAHTDLREAQQTAQMRDNSGARHQHASFAQTAVCGPHNRLTPPA